MPVLTDLHFECFNATTHLATRLGHRFIEHCYRWYVSAESTFVVVAERESRIVGLCAFNEGSYNRVFRHNLPSVLVGLFAHPSAVMHSGIQRRVWGRFRKAVRRSHLGRSEMMPAGCLAILAVRSAANGRGIGAEMVRRGIDEAATRGWRRITTGVHADNPALALYSRIGFVRVPVHDQDGLHAMEVLITLGRSEQPSPIGGFGDGPRMPK